VVRKVVTLAGLLALRMMQGEPAETAISNFTGKVLNFGSVRFPQDYTCDSIDFIPRRGFNERKTSPTRDRHTRHGFFFSSDSS
jgi:hypothetical protein